MTDQDLLAQALAHHTAGHLDEAEAIYLRILDEKPDDPDALHYLGVFACQRRELARAEELINRSLGIDPDNAKAHNNLGNVLRYRGRLGDAEAAFRRANDLDPGDAGALYNLGTVMLDQGKADEAIRQFRQAVALEPGDRRFAEGLAAHAAQLDDVDPDDTRLRDDLVHVLSFDGIDTAPLRRVVTLAVMRQPALARLLDAAGNGTDPPSLSAEALAQVMDDRLLTGYMAKDYLTDGNLERLLTRVRRRCLGLAVDGGLADAGGDRRSAFLAALAHQCFLNEYVFVETAEETASVDALEGRIAGAVEAGGTPDPDAVFVLAAYRPLAGTAFHPALADRAGDDPLMAGVIRRQVAEPMEERDIASAMPRLTPIRDAVSKAVRRQYEENPYPRWQHLNPKEPLPLSVLAGRRFPHLKTTETDWPVAPRILVAGAGTGREPVMHAQEYEGASVLAVDLSLASLAFGARMARKLGITDIEFAQADIMELGSMERRFDVIYCSGVLHHLEDPLAGWKVLKGLLADPGLMSVGLYSQRARQSVAAARDFVAAGDYPATREGVCRCRADIMDLAADDPVKGVMNTADFYATSACRDLIFHVREHRFTIPGIAAALDELGLRFLGFETRPSVLGRYRQRFPDDETLLDLENWHRLETDDPSIFWNLYQFWVTKA
ncbi:MAG: tetratricopeptide repeat protein [Rhodospirillales bacterium]